MEEPLIVTTLLDEAHQARFDELRNKHFPPERNHLAAHVTLFHHLPFTLEEQIRDRLSHVTKRAPLEAVIEKLVFLGNGVAFRIASPELMQFRSELVERWSDYLTPQDRTKGELHVKVQNKVAAERARELYDELSANFVSEPTTLVGLKLWRYLGGPWEAVEEYRFSSPG